MEGPKHRLLVVDDEKVIADTTALIFTQAGYEARAVNSAEDALELMPGWRPSVVIVDVLLPKMDGITLAQMIATKWPACRIILFSSQANLANQLDRVSVLAKPVPPEELLSVVSASLEALQRTEGDGANIRTRGPGQA